MSNQLSASLRSNDVGKKFARKIRKEGKIPAIIYRDGAVGQSIVIDPVALHTLFRKSQNKNTIVNIDLDGESIACLVWAVQRHPLSRDYLHIDFYAVKAGEKVKVMVPLVTEGKSAGANFGGRIRIVRREVPVRCTPDVIPEKLVVDVSELNIGDLVRAGAVSTPEGVELAMDSRVNVVSCYGRRVATE